MGINKQILTYSIIISTTIFASGCGGVIGVEDDDDAGRNGNGDGRRDWTSCPDADEWNPEDFISGELTRGSSGGGIELDVTLQNPLEEGGLEEENLRFFMQFTTHSGSVLNYDLTELTVIKNSEGLTTQSGFQWESVSNDSHHRSGYLLIPRITEDDKSIITCSTESITLTVSDIGDVIREFTYEREYLIGLSMETD